MWRRLMSDILYEAKKTEMGITGVWSQDKKQSIVCIDNIDILKRTHIWLTFDWLLILKSMRYNVWKRGKKIYWQLVGAWFRQEKEIFVTVGWCWWLSMIIFTGVIFSTNCCLISSEVWHACDEECAQAVQYTYSENWASLFPKLVSQACSMEAKV